MFSDIFALALAFLYNNFPIIAVVLLALVLLNALRLRARHVRKLVWMAKHTPSTKPKNSNWDMYGNTL